MTKTECAVYDLFKELGIPAHLSGYAYMSEAVKSAYEGEYGSVTTERPGCMYRDVAEKFNTTASKVERCMRHSIEFAFLNANPQYLYKVFGNVVDRNKGRPTNVMFVYQCAKELDRRISA